MLPGTARGFRAGNVPASAFGLSGMCVVRRSSTRRAARFFVFSCAEVRSRETASAGQWVATALFRAASLLPPGRGDKANLRATVSLPLLLRAAKQPVEPQAVASGSSVARAVAACGGCADCGGSEAAAAEVLAAGAVCTGLRGACGATPTLSPAPTPHGLLGAWGDAASCNRPSTCAPRLLAAHRSCSFSRSRTACRAAHVTSAALSSPIAQRARTRTTMHARSHKGTHARINQR